MTLTLTLDDPAARESALVGEKAAALARMKQAGLPVPPGFAVSIRAFDEALLPVASRIEALLEDDPKNERGSEASPEIQALVAAIRLSEPLRAALGNAYVGLASGQGELSVPPVAVRSSGTAEDLADASFAGMYSTYLNVSGPEEIIARIRDVWASAYSPHAIAYRQARGIPHAAARMAVLVQRQVAADASGVLFTRNPITGAKGRMLINAAYGLGEGVVAGAASADTFTLNSASLEIVERAITTKEQMVGFARGGGIEQQSVAPAIRDRPVLSDGQLAALGQLALEVKRIDGDDRDIEFAFTGPDVHLLQARPLTGLEEPPSEAEFPIIWDTPDDEEHVWMLSGGFASPTPLTRFAQEVQRAGAKHRQRAFEETGSPQARAYIDLFLNGYQYSRGPKVDRAAVTRLRRAHEGFADDLAAQGHDYYVDQIEPLVRDLLSSLGGFRRPPHESLAARFAHLARALEAGAYAMGDLHWRMTGAGSAKISAGWSKTFAEITGEPPINGTTLLQSIDHKTSQLVRRLRAIARVVQSDSELQELFKNATFEDLQDPAIRSRPAARRLHQRFRALLRDCGRRSGGSFGSSASFSTATWNLNPDAPLRLIASYAQQDLDELDRLEAGSRRERLNATRRIRRSLRSDPERLERFDSALRRVHNHVRSMENHNFYIEQGVVGVLREAIWWMGQALVRDGRLDEADDALHLSLEQLRAAVDGTAEDLRALVALNVEELRRHSLLHPPPYVGKGDPPAAFGPPGGTEAADRAAGLRGRTLKGEGASRGRHTGRARVFYPGGSMPEVVRGDILVAPNAGQDWAPILPLLGGIILDEGVIFQHAALVAREYRVPCVIQAREATTTIADGQIVTIDGEAGIVELDPVPSTE